MDILKKAIRGIAVSNVILIGLTGCSSTPAPWTQENDSPWGAKHAAEADTASSDGGADTSLNDPVLLADTEPEAAPAPEEAIVMQQPDAEPAPEVIVPVVVEGEPATQDIMSMLSSNYAVQVFAGNTVESVEKFKSKKDLPDLTTVKTDRSGSVVYVLVDIYPDRASANKAATELEIKTGSKPWVRSLAGLQKIAVP
jgi:septal ring-binding cell division protein DamX